MLASLIRFLWRRADRDKFLQWKRHVPGTDLLLDRWTRAKWYGFGAGSSVYDSCLVLGDVTVGQHTWIGPSTVLDGSGGLTIGEYCTISAGAQIYTHDSIDWALSGGTASYPHAPTVIGSRCYIGPYAVIVKGVTIGDECVIGAHALVTQNVQTGMMAAGCPARMIGPVTRAEHLKKIGASLVVLLLLAACGGGEPTGPSPVPTPAPAPIVAPDPARFDAAFNAQLVHDAFEHPGSTQRAQLLVSSPSIYLQTAGLSPATVAAMEAEARVVVPTLSGGKLSVATFETGPDVRAPLTGWIVTDLVNEADNPNCGRANIGARMGHVWLNMAHLDTCTRPLQHVFGHELGHALGFFHVADPVCLMSTLRPLAHNGLPCDKEQYHASLAYQSNGAYGSAQRMIVVD